MSRFLWDIGCNIGKWIDANYNEDYMFVGVEANPSVYERTKQKYDDKTNVSIINYLVAEVGGEERDFYLSQSTQDAEVSTASEKWINESRHKETTGWADPIKVKTITMDVLISHYGVPSVVKIDVEGYELNVLQGLSQKVGLISFEWVAEDVGALLDCIDRLEVLGYTGFHLMGGDAYDHKPSCYSTGRRIKNIIKKRVSDSAWGMLFARYHNFETKIISLETRADRLRATVAELPKIGVVDYEWFPAFTGGAPGCERSHIACLEGEGELLVLEDDVVFEPNAMETMTTAMSQLPDDWDLLYLGANVKEKASRHSANLFRVRSGVHCTHALLWSSRGRENMLALYRKEVDKAGVLPIDHWLYISGLNLMNCYVVWPMIAFQRPDHSDIRLEYYDYREEMLRHQKINME